MSPHNQVNDENYPRSNGRHAGIQRCHGAHRARRGPQHDLLIASSVEKQFGAAIRHTLLEVLQRYEVEPVQVIVDDKGRWTACCAPGWKRH